MTLEEQEFEQERLLWHAYISEIVRFKALEPAVDAGDQEALADYRAAVDRAIELARQIYHSDAPAWH